MLVLKMLIKHQKILKISEDLLYGIAESQKSPIFLVGLPRSGTTWIGSVLNTAPGTKYFFEPFNWIYIPASAQHLRKYLRGDDCDEEFAQYCRSAFAGRLDEKHFILHLSWLYKQLRWFPGRVAIKDVHCFLALEWIHQHMTPTTVIVMRHPCAVAASWFRLWGETQIGLHLLLEQPKLMNDYLQPFEDVIKTARGFWQKIGAFWGAMYYVMLEQQKKHPSWIVVQHEQFCQNPTQAYRQLFERLDLPWSARTDELLEASTQKKSKNPFMTQRISSQEPDKWRKELEPWQIEEIQQFVRAFGIQPQDRWS